MKDSGGGLDVNVYMSKGSSNNLKDIEKGDKSGNKVEVDKVGYNSGGGPNNVT